MSFGARALIQLGALEHNVSVIRNAAPAARIMAVIKANAYGHGLETIAAGLAGVDALAVARLPEALRLREIGIDMPVVLLSGVQSDEELAIAVEQHCDVVVHCPEQVELLKHCTGRLRAWLKVDTGMNRLGFAPDQAERRLQELSALPSVSEIGLMSHLASADELDNPTTPAQLRRFAELLKSFKGPVSIANSPATLGWPEVARPAEELVGGREYWIRPGLALFGISPFAGQRGADLGLQAVMQFEARLIAVKPLAKHARVGYRGSYLAPADSILGIISAGYGDGYSRHFRTGTPILINGRRVPLIGDVSMDLLAVDLGAGSRDRVGDIATLWGPALPVEEVAPWADAIPYELVCGVMNREASKVVP